MFLLIVIIVILVVVGVLVWYFTRKPKTPEPVSFYSQQSQCVSNDGMSVSTFERPITTTPGTIETEQKLLEIAKRHPPHPQVTFQSRLRRDGNPLIGDLKIVPRTTGLYVPLNADPDDLNVGYFSY